MRLKHGPLRDALGLVAVFGLLLGGLYAYTGVWPPAVIVESSSMMHPDHTVTYGRYGTIDPGDLVLVKDIDSPEDVQTLVEGDAAKSRYGLAGDVIIYFPYNNHAATPIIHRAVAYVEVVGSGADIEYRVRWDPDAECEGGARKDGKWCVYGADGVYVPSVPIARLGSSAQSPQPYRPEHSGFLTKGDNEFSNRNIDQVAGISPTVQLEWVEGKGRAELPWLGLIKLSLAGHPNERNPAPSWVKIGSAYAPADLWVMLGVSLFILVGVPLIYDGYKAVKARQDRKAPVRAPTLTAGEATHGSVRLTWDAVPLAHNYRVYRDGALIGSTRETWFVDANLDPGRAYAYAVASVNEAGDESLRSAEATARTLSPSPP